MFVLKIIHLLIAISVIVGVLLQSGKSAGMSGVIDGGASQFLGNKSKGLDEKLSKFTTVAAVVFMVTSLILAII
ncbi:MAG: preprotein translocase subunit SecG [Halanaerobiales bacterium]|nr:preprotein translocase subunit SecG [Halanaerobiales bacterium]